MSITKNKSWLEALAFSNIYIIWGITFIAISYGLTGFPPFILSGLRFGIAGLLILTYLRYKGERANSIANWRKNFITGNLILTGGSGLVVWGEQYVSASEASIAIATGPLWFIAIDRSNWRKYFSDKWIPIGLLLGFIGLILFLSGSISNPGASQFTDSNFRIAAFAVLAVSSITWVLGSLYSKHHPANHSTWMNIAQQLISAGIVSLIVAGFRNEWQSFSTNEIQLSAVAGILFLIFFGSIVAYVSYIWLLSVKSAAIVSTHTYINPIITVIAGTVLGNEIINSNQLLGLFIILLGVLMTNATKYFKLSNRSKVKIRKTTRVLARISRPYTYNAY